MCTVVLRYSNSTLADFTEYMLLPMVKEGLNHTTGDANGFIELVSQAMKEKLEIHLAILSGTSLLLDGAAGYTGGMAAIYELTLVKVFKLCKSRDDKTRITTVIFPQPALPAAGYEYGPGKT